MFNIDAEVMAAQSAAKSEAEKKAFTEYVVSTCTDGLPFHEILDQMASDERISVDSLIRFCMIFFM